MVLSYIIKFYTISYIEVLNNVLINNKIALKSEIHLQVVSNINGNLLIFLISSIENSDVL